MDPGSQELTWSIHLSYLPALFSCLLAASLLLTATPCIGNSVDKRALFSPRVPAKLLGPSASDSACNGAGPGAGPFGAFSGQAFPLYSLLQLLSEVSHVSCWRLIGTSWPDFCGQLQEEKISTPRSLQQPTLVLSHLAFKNALQFWFGGFEIFWGHKPPVSLHGHAINPYLPQTLTFWFVWLQCASGIWTWANNLHRCDLYPYSDHQAVNDCFWLKYLVNIRKPAPWEEHNKGKAALKTSSFFSWLHKSKTGCSF